jgi:hypothetical protein
MEAVFKIKEISEGHTFEVKYYPDSKEPMRLQGAKLLILESIVDEFYCAAKTKIEEQLINDFKEWVEEKKKIFKVK